MLRSVWYWGGAFVINAAWAVLLPTEMGSATALLGAAIALTALGTLLARRGRNGRNGHDGAPEYWRQAWLLAPFLLPVISFLHISTFAFWSLDARGWLIAAWLITAVRGALQPSSPAPAAPPGPPAPAAASTAADTGSVDEASRRSAPVPFYVGLFILWTSVFWLTVVWDLGVGRFVVNVDRSAGVSCHLDPLANIFQLWEQQPASEHLYLGWRTRDGGFDQQRVYVNHVHPYLLTMYAWVSAVRAVTGRPMTVATNTTPFLYMFVLLGSVTVLLARLGLLRKCRDAGGLIVLFAGFGFLVTTWRFWGDLYRYTSDNTFPLLAAVLVLVYAAWLTPVRPWLAFASGTLFLALAPIHTPFLILAVVCLFGQYAARGRDLFARNRLIAGLSVWWLVVAFVVAAAPRLLAAWKGYTAVGSSLLVRSGLDGDTSYFTGLAQAIWSPTVAGCYVRPPVDLLLPACVPLLALIPWIVRANDSSGRDAGRMLVFLATPYLCSLIFFAQSISVHPYLYDLLLLVPVVVTGLAVMLMEPVRQRLTGTMLLVGILFASALIMTNLISLAQVLKHMP
jgi:hypothetical protein